MTSLEPKELILEIIARLRNRKARPDLEKISHMAKRKYGLTSENTEEMLNKLVRDGIVNKVTYKGRTSYRNAAKCSKSRSNSEILNRKASAKLRDAIQSLMSLTGGSCLVSSTATGAGGLNNKNQEKIMNDTNNNEATSNGNRNSMQTQRKLVAGVSLNQIECWWREQSFDATLSKIDLNTLIKNEVAARRIQTLANGNYVSCRGGSTVHSITNKTFEPAGEKRSEAVSNKSDGGCNNLEQQSDRISTKHTTNKNCIPKPPCKRGRPASKRKKFLKNHGPDFHAEMPVAILGIDKCDFCLQPANSSPNGQNESLLSCKDCSAKAHPSCMNYSPELALRAHQSPWQCTNCKVCNICRDSGNADAMLICDLCDKGYHMKCLAPPLNKKPTGLLAVAGNWVCSVCDKNNNNKKEKSPTSLKDLNASNKESCMYEPPTPCESPELPVMPADNFGELQKRRSVYDGPYPNVTNFTVDEIVQFFKSKGFGKEADAFSKQEIDGKSLLLMKRDDVLMGLRDYICLGPALKIFKHVERLQWASE